jgi:hypothetical protein
VLPEADEPIRLTQKERRQVKDQRRVANRRTSFKQPLLRVAAYVEEQKLARAER